MPLTTDVKDYIEGLLDDRKKAVSEIRKAINKNLPKGFKEGIGYNMIMWSVPHSSYPAGYHCDPSKPLMLIGLSSTKGHISLHHMGLYGSTPLMNWFKSEWPKHSMKKLDIGKACIRFKKLDDVPLDLIGKLASKLTPQQWVEQYEKALSMRTARK
jgi:uncharacterized protein YdhG (YjbR/CyaY superfamily)